MTKLNNEASTVYAVLSNGKPLMLLTDDSLAKSEASAFPWRQLLVLQTTTQIRAMINRLRRIHELEVVTSPSSWTPYGDAAVRLEAFLSAW